MMNARDEKLEAIIDWANKNADIRAALLTSSLVNPLAVVDEFSDIDIELVFENSEPYLQQNNWLSNFGLPIAVVEEDKSVFEDKHAMKMVMYDDYVKVDFKLYEKSEFLKEVRNEVLQDDWDIGYKLLVDKDELTKTLKKPSYKTTIIAKPTEKEFKQLVNDFWWDLTYVAKCLAREEIFYAKFMSENMIRTDYLLPLLEWYIANEHNWQITTNKHGRFFKKYLSTEIWQKVEKTFSDANIGENWNALFAFVDLFHSLATKLADTLGFSYPVKLEIDIRKYLNYVRFTRP